jgi:group I intron endonuclease
MGFIYKITNIQSGKMYIGETSADDPDKRWKKHLSEIKGNRGCPALRDAIKKYGEDTFKFEVMIICFDKDRFIYEKEYIKKYNTQVPNGYNILPGGEGGGFLGKKHTPETLLKIKKSTEIFKQNNPNHYETYREYHTQKTKEANISERLKNSEKWKKALAEKRVGANSHSNKNGMSEDTKQKISNSVKKYFENNDNHNRINIVKHQTVMAEAVGKKIKQFTENNELIKEYPSISEAGRTSGVKKSNIQRVLNNPNKKAGGYFWKYSD